MRTVGIALVSGMYLTWYPPIARKRSGTASYRGTYREMDANSLQSWRTLLRVALSGDAIMQVAMSLKVYVHVLTSCDCWQDGQEYKVHHDAFDPKLTSAENLSKAWGPVSWSLMFSVLTMIDYNVDQFYYVLWDLLLCFKGMNCSFMLLRKQSGTRVATVIMHLRKPEEGGETEFPLVNLKVDIGRTK